MIRWLTAWLPSLPRSQWWLTMRWTPPATCILSNKPCCILVATDLLPLFFGNAICCPRFPVASSSSTDMHSCCHSFVASLFWECNFLRFWKCSWARREMRHSSLFLTCAACLSFQRRWQLNVGCMCFGVWIHCIKWRHLLILSKKVADAACDSYLLGNTLGALWNTCAAGLSFQRRWQSLHAIWSSAL